MCLWLFHRVRRDPSSADDPAGLEALLDGVPTSRTTDTV